MFTDIRRGNTMEFITLASGQDGYRNFLRVGGGQYKENMGRWFFQSLQQSIECFLGKHMYFIDDIHFLF